MRGLEEKLTPIERCLRSVRTTAQRERPEQREVLGVEAGILGASANVADSHGLLGERGERKYSPKQRAAAFAVGAVDLHGGSFGSHQTFSLKMRYSISFNA
jgi:hypothetical protein